MSKLNNNIKFQSFSPKKFLFNTQNEIYSNDESHKNKNFKEKINILSQRYDNAISYYTKNINNDQTNTSFLIKRSICYLAKNLYVLALKDALKSIEINPNFAKGFYIASLCYLEMYNIEMAEKYCLQENQKLKDIISKTKQDLMIKCKKYKIYPLFITFLKELYIYNAFFPKLEIHFYSENYRGIIARNHIEKNEIILTIPFECMISLQTVLNTNYGKKIGSFMQRDLASPKHCLLTSFILFEEKNPKWKFYFDLLPKDFSNFPIFYTDKELEYLKGSPFLNQILDKKKDLKSDYDTLCMYINDFNKFDFKKFCEIRMVVSSRIFGISIYNNKTDVLVPFADLLNHKRPKQTQWYFDTKLNSFVIQATEEIEKGDEIFDSYGKKTNARFLLNYGFALEDNDTSEYILTVKFNENYPLYNEKKFYFKKEKNYCKSFNLNINIYESQILELLSFLRFILFNGNLDDINKYNFMKTNNNDLFENQNLSYFFIPPINKELEIQVLQKLLYLCQIELSKYPTSMEQDKQLLKVNKNINFNEKNILLLLINEKSVLKYYIHFCEYCLELIKLNNKKEVLAKITNDINYSDFQFDFYIQDAVFRLVNE